MHWHQLLHPLQGPGYGEWCQCIRAACSECCLHEGTLAFARDGVQPLEWHYVESSQCRKHQSSWPAALRLLSHACWVCVQVGWFPEYTITEDYALSMELKAAGFTVGCSSCIRVVLVHVLIADREPAVSSVLCGDSGLHCRQRSTEVCTTNMSTSAGKPSLAA